MLSSLSLRAVAVVVLFIASLMGICTPLIVGNKDLYLKLMPYLQCIAAGIMLGLALIHLSPDAADMLSSVVPQYPLSYALTAFGVIAVLTIEQMSVAYIENYRLQQIHSTHNDIESRQNQPNCKDHVHQCSEDPENHHCPHNEECGFVNCSHHDNCDLTKPNHDVQSSPKHSHKHSHDISPKPPSMVQEDTDHEHHHETMTLNEVLSANSLQDLILAYTLEISTAIHSVVIGVNLGLLTRYPSIAAYLIALCFHQFIEGLGLGNVIFESKKNLGTTKIIVFVLVFSLTVSIGVIIGILTSSNKETPTAIAIEGVVTSIAAGSLLYTSLVEMTATYFHHSHHHKGNWKMKLGMIGAYSVGVMIMAIIGIYA